MSVIVGEQVKVMAVFDGNVRPVKFRWRGRVLPVVSVTHSWKTREGADEVVHFSVTDGAGTLYELAYNKGSLQWTVEEVEAP